MGNSSGIVVAVWWRGRAPQKWKDPTIKLLHKQKDRTECGNCHGISLMVHTSTELVKVIAGRPSDN